MNIDPNAGLSAVGTATNYMALPAADETARELNKTYLKLLADSEQFPWLNAEGRATDFTYSPSDLLTVTSVQSQAARQATRLIADLPLSAERLAAERSVTGSLAGSIEKNAQQLQIIMGWTQGGIGAFTAAINQMFNAYQGVNLQGIDYENLFQVGLLDVLINQDKYGFISTSFLEMVGATLEKTGSGSHNNWDYTPEQIGDMVDNVWRGLHTQIATGAIGPDALIYKVMEKISGGPPTATMPAAFRNQFTASVYNNPNDGGWITGSLTQLSPMSRIVLLSTVIASHEVSQAEITTFLTGSKAQLDQLVMAKTGKDALTIIFSSGRWQDSHSPVSSLPPGVTQALDYDGWIDVTYLQQLYQNFPPKNLTKEDLREINNIGDQVKMLMQSLKYWLTTMRDEQLSISRNMS